MNRRDLACSQAPVSDREALSTEENYAESLKLLKKAETMVAEGHGEDLLTKHYGFVPMTASRYASLFGKGGMDDFFSSDLTDEELKGLLGHMCTAGQQALAGTEDHPGLKVLVASSMADQYVPAQVDREKLATRLTAAMSGDGEDVVNLMIEDGNHNLSLPEDGAAADDFVQNLCAILKSII